MGLVHLSGQNFPTESLIASHGAGKGGTCGYFRSFAQPSPAPWGRDQSGPYAEITSSPEDMGNDETRLEASANYDILRTCSSIDLLCHQQYAIVIVDVFNSIISQRT